MANTGVKGIDVVQTGTAIIFRAFLLNASGQLVTSGGTNLLLYEMQSDGSLKSYDFSSNTFKTTTLTTESVTMTHQTGNAGATNTGVWTYALSTLTGFTVGAVYLFRVNNTTAAPNDQWREFQYGGDQGDLLVTQGSTGQAYLQADVEEWVGAAPDALSSGLVQATLGGTPNVNVTEWGGSAVTGMPMPTYTQPTGFLAATFPTTVASPTNITAGTITTVSGNVNGSVASVTAVVSANVTEIAGQTANAAGAVTFPSSIGTSTFAGGAVASVTGNVGGNVTGSVGSISGVTFPTHFASLAIDASGFITYNNAAPPSVATIAAAVAAEFLFDASGYVKANAESVGDKTGYALSSAGLDGITVESGINPRQALSLIASAVAGVLSGAAGPTVTILGAGVSSQRIQATVDANGDRTAVTLSPPM